MEQQIDRKTRLRSDRRKRIKRRRKCIVSVLASLVLLATISALILPAITMEKTPICGLEAHTHGPECYREEKVLICGFEGTAQTPGEETLPEQSEPEAPGESLPDAGDPIPEESEAAQPEPVPEIPSEPAPEVIPAVLAEEPEIALETAPPVPGETESVPETTDPVPGETEAMPETTDPVPVETETVPETTDPIPGETEAMPETTDPIPAETEAVPETTDPVPVETEVVPETTDPIPGETEAVPEETVHVHTEACYEVRQVLICEKQEHIHTEQCFEQSDPYADVESSAEWEASFSSVEKSGWWAEDVLALAKTQLGYRESTKNFTWNEKGNKLGYSRYGDWYGLDYGDWCAMFLSFCLHYSGVPAEAIPPQASCPIWIQQMQELGIYLTEGQPAVGDILFLDFDADASADHVVLVEEVADGQIHTIEGNSADTVQRMQYPQDSSQIMGFCPLAQVQQRLNAVPDQRIYNLSFTDERMTVAVTITGLSRLLPEDAVLAVRELTPETDPEAYTAAVARGEATLEENHRMGAFSVFDFAVLSGDKEISIPETADVTVNIQFTGPVVDPEILDQGGALQPLILDDLLPAQPAPAPTVYTAASAAAPEETQDAANQVETNENGFTFHAKGLPPFAVMVTNHTQNGNFWKEVRHGEKLEKGQTYILVSAEGGYALTNNGGKVFTKVGPNYTPVQLEPVKGNTGYYTIPNTPDTIKWKYNEVFGANASPRLTQMYTGRECFINPAYPAYLFVAESNAGPLQFNNSGAPSCFHIENRKQDKYISIGTMESGFTGVATPSYDNDIRDTDMLMLKMVNTTLTIPDDAVAPDGGSGQIGSANKPSYPAYIEPSGSKTGSYEDTAGKVDYYSDPSTTRLETGFGIKNNSKDFTECKGDNGKAMMDKSVIYGRDDYGAFAQYGDGTFSTTLSALGQAFVVDQSTTKVPIDVLFILDMSNSMNEKDPGQSVSRAQILVDAVNKTMNNIMKAHPENRVCAVGYNSGAYDLLALGHHWKGEGGQYFKYTPTGKNQYGQPSGNIQATGLSGLLGKPVPCENGTYTQMGIAQGYQLLTSQTPNPQDRTYTTTVNGQTITRPRKPVIILVSDGEPTHCTNHYTDVLQNPYYGDGLGPVSNGKGVQGYYTILSANYYKRMVGIHYNNPAAMYTVAFGMKEGDYQQLGDSAATNHYRATVMNPTQGNISNLQNVKTQYSNQVEKPLYQMLIGTYPQPYQEVGKQLDLIPSMGKPHVYIPILKNNPYRGNYAYADKAFLGNTGNAGLDAAFDEIIKLNTVYDFSYETQANKPLTLYDPIGDGMEVKGDPVLRVNGINYKHTGKQNQGSAIVYTYSGVVPMDPYTGRTVDLSTIQVRVETGNGKQSVSMAIPPKSLPTYTADPTMSFYHEALPIRLIYQVGLSPAGQAQIDALQPGETKTFYTNRYTGGDHARGTLEPSDKNPYYKKTGWQRNNAKTQNITQTDGYFLNQSGNAQKVDYLLGNNGKLVITKKAPPTPPVEPVSVQKNWQNYNGDPLDANLPDKITATLYRTYVDEAGKTVREDVLTFELSADNGWKRTFSPEELNAVPGRHYQYYVEETKLPDYHVSYEGDGVLTNTPENPIVIVNRYRYSDVVLPDTGGPGTFLFTGMGMLLMAASLILYRCVLRPKRQEGRNTQAS